MYDIKAIYEANTIEDAIKLKTKHPNARFIAGGSDVLVKIREGKMAGLELISIYLCDELRGVSLEDDGTLRIGALTSFSHITEDELVKKYCPTLGEAVDTAGGPQLRNIATIGGNICNGVPSADSATTVLVNNGIIELVGRDGKREVLATDFYKGFGKVDIKDTELMTAIKIKKEDYDGYLGSYYKYAMRNAMDIATSSCSISLKFKEEDVVCDIRAAYGVAAPIPVRVFEAEKWMKGKKLTEENMKSFSKKILEELSPRDSWRASKSLRTQILYEITFRCLKTIYDKHKGGQDAH